MSNKIEVDTKTFVRFWLVILAFVVSGLLLWRAKSGILIVLIALFFAIALSPLAKKIDQFDKHKKRSSLTSVLAVLSVVTVIGLVFGLVGPVVINETAHFIEQAPAVMDEAMNSPWINEFGLKIGVEDLKSEIIDSVNGISKKAIKSITPLMVGGVSAIGQVITGIILVTVLAILFMLEGPRLLESFWRSVEDRNAKLAQVSRRVIERMAGVITTYVSRQVMIAILDGMMTTLVVLILSMVFGFSAGLAMPMGLISMGLYLIPLFGPIIASVLISAILAFNMPLAGLCFLVFYIIYQQVENNIIAPKIQGRGLAMSPLIILVSITIGMYAFGLIGTVIAIPVAGCIKVLFEEYPQIKKLS